jgi:hypothetical protein
MVDPEEIEGEEEKKVTEMGIAEDSNEDSEGSI